MNSPPRQRDAQADLIWHLLLADLAWQVMRNGGLRVVDHLVHACVLIIATILLLKQTRGHRLPRTPLVLAAIVLVLGLVQLLPLPAALFGLLAPVKAEFAAAINAIYPGLVDNRQITLIPEFHVFKWMSLVNDAVLMTLVLVMRPPRLRIVWAWTYVLALGMSLLMVLATAAGEDGPLWLEPFRDTFGGLVNFNHFGTTMVVLMIFVCAHLILVIRSWRHDHAYAGSDPTVIGRYLSRVVLALFTLAVSMVAFQQGFSRTAVFNLMLGGGLFTLLCLNDAKRTGWRILLPTAIVILLLLFLPLGRNFEKFRKGFDPNGRFALMHVGMEYLGQFPVLGTGLGSTEELLDPRVRKLPRDTSNFREFHNDPLQVAVELGWPGLACLLWGVGWCAWVLWRRRRDVGPDHRLMIYASLCMLFAYGLHSLVSFPLRVNALRYLIIILLGAAIHVGSRGKSEQAPRRWGLILLLLILPTTTYWGWQTKRALNPANRTNAPMQFAADYGRFYRLEFFRANRDMGDAFQRFDQPQAMRRKLVTVQQRLETYLQQQPFSLKALNLLFMCEVLTARIDSPDYDPDRYAGFKAKATALNTLGKDRNIQSRMAMLFLLSTYQDHLNAADRDHLASLRKPFELRMQRIRIRDGLLPEEPQ